MLQATSSSVCHPQNLSSGQGSAPLQKSKAARLRELSQADLFANESPKHDSSAPKGIRSASSTNHLEALDMSKPNATTLDGLYHWEKQVPNRVYMNQPLPNGKVDQLTWGQFAQDVRKIAQHLNDLGLEKGSSVAIFSRNTAYFQIASMAINHAGMVSVPLHAEMKPDEINYALKDSDAKAIFIGKLDQSLVNNLKKADQVTHLHQIQMPTSPDNLAEHVSIDNTHKRSQWDDILETTSPLAGKYKPGLDKLATIVYTSGSSGKPKGAEHTYGSMATALKTLAQAAQVSPDDRMLSHLMLSHVAERAAVETSLFRPMTIDFADTIATLKDDLIKTKPTIFMTVPKVWASLDDKIVKGVAEAVEGKPLGKLVACKKTPHAKLDALLSIPLVGRKVRAEALKKAGLGEARLLLSGAGPIGADITKRYGIGQGYGATENYANVTLDNPSQKIKHGTVGPLSKSVEYKLDNAQEKNGRSQGELLIKTKSLMRGYRNQPEKTAEVMTHDGFYKTGDLASVDKKGYVSILGRMSNNFKTANGTFVNAGEIQQQIKAKAAPYIEDAFIFLDKKADKPAAALQLSPLGYLRLNPKSPEYDASLKEKVIGQLNTAITAFNASREKGEPKLSHVILAKQWTQDNDLLNSTNKPKIPSLMQHYQSLDISVDSAVFSEV
ncbi:MAG TPA: hypothetical protein DHW71_13955 [Gammaproteobacteria bacterium]|mgnify:FL=1|nr:hypothetical protein [Gammaproteobacteria bacterium]|tara:strand:+ start:499 stop:2499 length:2001 start_codon:yes stop_codon:yes gene_type:complete